MFLSLFLACTLSISSHILQSDTIPKGQAPTFATEGERQASEAQQVFRDHYSSGYYPPFEGSITWIAPGIYRLDSFTMRIDSLPPGCTGLLSRGLLFPGRMAPLFGSTDTVSIRNLYELKGASPSPQIRRFTCWIYNSQFANPVWYVFELTNEQGAADTEMAAFIQNARLTFLYQVSIII